MIFLLAALLALNTPAAAQLRIRAPAAPTPIVPLAGVVPVLPAGLPATERLWIGSIPESAAKAQLARAHWETTKFFFGSRVKMLREMIEQQKASSRALSRAVNDLEGMWLDWRTQSYAGAVTTAGFLVADRATIRRDALKIFERRFPKDETSRGAFKRYLARVDAVVPLERPSNYRKRAYSVFYELALASPAELPARIDAMLSPAHIAGFAAHRSQKQAAVMAGFKVGTLATIDEVNRGLPEGKKVIALILLGSYAIGQSTPDSDIDYQLMTQDGSADAIAPFRDVLDKRWTQDKLDKIEAFQFALPPSRDVVVASFPEGYQVISPDPEAVSALSKTDFSPAQATAWSRLRGNAFGSFYRAWCWTYLRWAQARSRASRRSEASAS